MLVDNSGFLSGLERLLRKSNKDSSTVTVTTKRFDSEVRRQRGPVEKRTAPPSLQPRSDAPAAVPGNEQSHPLLIRAVRGDKKLSTRVAAADYEAFQAKYLYLLRQQLTGLQQAKKRKIEASTHAKSVANKKLSARKAPK
ncbi:hypothetical protein IWQ60_011284 [Tieghemiomyces parasiticus]|uniref:Signal recognition particle subunit SRP14 n=1 Tax=Tieghemiomyces parasiticus TaxID=78921 RepID=A0A9W8DLP8_9FUNG|nr:hypothetical protein IWQ60_011284 [Tieghemiomyces parasiticus]